LRRYAIEGNAKKIFTPLTPQDRYSNAFKLWATFSKQQQIIFVLPATVPVALMFVFSQSGYRLRCVGGLQFGLGGEMI
jgi:hypothetical protein